MSCSLKALLSAAAVALLLSSTQAQAIASLDISYFSDTACLQPIPGPVSIHTEIGLGSGVGTPLTIPATEGPFGSAIVLATSNIDSLTFCEFGCSCFQAGCNNFPVSVAAIGTNECVNTLSLVDGNGNPLLPGTQFDKFSVTVV